MAALTPDEAILGLLAAQARHGYQLVDIFNEPSQLGNVWHLSTSQLYAVLKRLEREGKILGQDFSSENAPTRTEYSISASGKEELEAWLNEENPSASIRCVRVEFLTRLYVAQILQVPCLPILNRQRRVCQREHERRLKETRSAEGISSLATELVIAQLEAVITWLNRCELVLEPTKD